jgi:hypothetical protein
MLPEFDYRAVVSVLVVVQAIANEWLVVEVAGVESA